MISVASVGMLTNIRLRGLFETSQQNTSEILFSLQHNFTEMLDWTQTKEKTLLILQKALNSLNYI